MRIKIRNGILHFNDLFVPKVVGKNKDKEPSFSATILVDDDTEVIYQLEGEPQKKKKALKTMPLLCDRVMKDKWTKKPAKLKNWVWNKADGSTTRDEYVNKNGDYHDGIDEDTWFVSAKKKLSKCPEGGLLVIDQGREPIEDHSRIYAGCRVTAIIDVYGFDSDDGGPCISASLEGVQLLKKGERLKLGGGGGASSDDFDEEEPDEDWSDEDNDDDDESDGL